MGLYVEVMCDERKQWPKGSGHFHNRCESDSNNNPQGRSVKEARDAAKKAGWIVRGSYSVCPPCQKDTPNGQ